MSSRRKHGKGSEQRELTTSCNLHCMFAVGVGILRICIVRVHACVRAFVPRVCVPDTHLSNIERRPRTNSRVERFTRNTRVERVLDLLDSKHS